MSKFTLEEKYGVSRNDYCFFTGITPDELIRHLDAEVFILKSNLRRLSDEYRESGSVVSKEQRLKAELIQDIESSIAKKKAKIKDIKENV